MTDIQEGLKAAIRAAKLALFVIRKQGVMPNSSWEVGFERDLKTAEDALASMPLTGCLHPGNEPLSCQYEGQCLSVSCNHNGKTWYGPRMTLEAQVDGILYPNNNEGK